MQTRITTLGRFEVASAGKPVEALARQPLRFALLAYLAVEESVSAESVMDMFWGERDPKRAKHSLADALYQLRRDVGDDAVVREGAYIRAGAEVSTDVHEFLDHHKGGRYGDAIRLYGGAFLEGFPSVDAVRFEHWVDQLRRTLERTYAECQGTHLGRLVETGHLDQALDVVGRWVTIDPLDDDAQHALISLLCSTGRRAEALRQYEEYKTVLGRELGVDPLDRTQELIHKLKDARELPSRIEGVSLGRRDIPQHQVAPPAPQLPPAMDEAWLINRATALRRRWYALVALSVLSVAGVWAVWRQGNDAPELRDPAVVAVLPFIDGSPNGDWGWLGDALAKQLIADLRQVQPVTVRSWQDVRRFKESSLPPESIAVALNVGTIVTGSLVLVGDSMDFHLEMIDGNDPRDVQGAVFRRAINSYVDVFRDIGTAIERTLRLDVGRRGDRADYLAEADGARAFEWFERGRTEVEEVFSRPLPRTASGAGLTLLGLARADSLLALAQAASPQWEQPVLERGWLKQRLASIPASDAEQDSHLREAIGYADSLLAERPSAGAFELRGVSRLQFARVRARPSDWPGSTAVDSAITDLERSVEIDPGRAKAHSALTLAYYLVGDFSAAAAAAFDAMRSDAWYRRDEVIRSRLFYIYLQLGEFSSAANWCDDGRRDFPDSHRFLMCRMHLIAFGGAPNTTLAEARAEQQSIASRFNHEGDFQVALSLAYLAMAELRLGVPVGDAAATLARGRSLANETGHPSSVSSFALSEAYFWAAAGQTDVALTTLRTYIANNPHEKRVLAEDYGLRPLRNLDAFQRLVAQD